MTLAGTRPPTVDEWDKYELHHRARLATKPGLTGMWQVSGRSNITDLRKMTYKQEILFIFSSLIILNYLNIEWVYQGFEEYRYITIRSFIVKILSLKSFS